MAILNVIATQVLGDPVIVLGLVALIGLILLKKSKQDILLGTIKVMLGYIILSAGAGFITGALDPLTKMIRAGLGVEGVVPLYWPVFAKTMATFGTQVALVFVFGFIINLLLSKFTPLHFLALTVHLQLFWAGFIVVVLDAVNIKGVNLILIGSIISGFYYWLVTAISYHYMKDTLTDEHANFVPSVMGMVVAGLLGKILGKGKSSEELEISEGFSWVKDTIVSISVVMFIVYIIFALVAGIPFVEKELSGGKVWFIYLLSTALQFGGAVAVILYGVRMLLAEIIPAFTGISERLLPNAKMGLDYPTIYPYAGTAVLLGFLCHLGGSIVATLSMLAIGFSPLVIPGVQINFFEGALIGVYANSRGGIRNVILSNLIIGFILQFGVAFVYPDTGILAASGGAYEAIDFNTIGLLITKLLHLF
jgi:PTS system ascorbate-specific IIC component